MCVCVGGGALDAEVQDQPTLKKKKNYRKLHIGFGFWISDYI